MRLIDADALLREVIYQRETAKKLGYRRVYNGLSIACTEIIDAPTIEPEPTKYKWHDLRKNPADLPCKDGTYRCVFRDDVHTYFDCDYRDGIGFGKECFDAHNELTGSPIEYYFECFDEDDEVIGWQEIEPFEVEEC